mmetsp:Transcript_14996/g.25782  ORF Transcript_14996/g.25782 Transcript_14996/m.25782 type:complete len:204 (-) Transcript_14996:900-1511(-)
MLACTRQPTAIRCSSTRGSSPTAPTNTCCRSTPTCRPRPRRPRLVPRRRRRQPTRRCQLLRLVLRLLITNRVCRPPVASVNGLRCPNVHVVVMEVCNRVRVTSPSVLQSVTSSQHSSCSVTRKRARLAKLIACQAHGRRGARASVSAKATAAPAFVVKRAHRFSWRAKEASRALSTTCSYSSRATSRVRQLHPLKPNVTAALA